MKLELIDGELKVRGIHLAMREAIKKSEQQAKRVSWLTLLWNALKFGDKKESA